MNMRSYWKGELRSNPVRDMLADYSQWHVAGTGEKPKAPDRSIHKRGRPNHWSGCGTLKEARRFLMKDEEVQHIGFRLLGDGEEEEANRVAMAQGNNRLYSSAFVVIDIDVGCPQKVIDHILETMPTYCERSASGKGYHLWVMGEWRYPKNRWTGLHVEVYSSGRFMVWTDDQVDNGYNVIYKDDGTKLGALYEYLCEADGATSTNIRREPKRLELPVNPRDLCLAEERRVMHYEDLLPLVDAVCAADLGDDEEIEALLDNFTRFSNLGRLWFGKGKLHKQQSKDYQRILEGVNVNDASSLDQCFANHLVDSGFDFALCVDMLRCFSRANRSADDRKWDRPDYLARTLARATDVFTDDEIASDIEDLTDEILATEEQEDRWELLTAAFKEAGINLTVTGGYFMDDPKSDEGEQLYVLKTTKGTLKLRNAWMFNTGMLRRMLCPKPFLCNVPPMKKWEPVRAAIYATLEEADPEELDFSDNPAARLKYLVRTHVGEFPGLYSELPEYCKENVIGKIDKGPWRSSVGLKVSVQALELITKERNIRLDIKRAARVAKFECNRDVSRLHGVPTSDVPEIILIRDEKMIDSLFEWGRLSNEEQERRIAAGALM